jgi:uncharacterized protein
MPGPTPAQAALFLGIVARMSDHINEIDLMDWKRTVFDLYAQVRADDDPVSAWRSWRKLRDELFRSHPQSPIPEPHRAGYDGIPMFEHDPAMRVAADLAPGDGERIEIATSGEAPYAFRRVALARFELGGSPQQLSVFWLEGYGGGLFVSFRDATSGTETYGAGRYLLDTIKGADLGMDGARLVLDFNFAYNPSCSYDPRWVCPLAPPENRIDLPVRAGERLAT